MKKKNGFESHSRLIFFSLSFHDHSLIHSFFRSSNVRMFIHPGPFRTSTQLRNCLVNIGIFGEGNFSIQSLYPHSK